MKKILLFSVLVVLISSCTNMLEEVPKSFLSPVNYYKTATDANGAILSVYPIRSGLAVNQNMLAEDQIDYVTITGSWGPAGVLNQPFESVMTGRSDGLWNDYYNIINRANIVLARVPDIAMDAVIKKNILAEANFLRADAYLNLVRYWGAVPLRLTETNDLNSLGASRSPIVDVYKQIISDLKIAETDLPEVGTKTGRASKWAAKIRLADVYLDIEDWANAASKADEVIKSNKYSLVTVQKESDFYKIFATETSSEDVYSLHYSTISTGWSNMIQWCHYTDTPVYNLGTGWAILYVNVKCPLVINWNQRDLRNQFNIYSKFLKNGVWVNNPSTTPLLFKKYIKDPNGYCTHSVPIIRYAEAFLIYAEAACMAEASPSALTLERLNIIKRRGYGYPLTTASVDDYPSGMTKVNFRNAVIQERAYEFMLEGHRYWDLIRTKTIKQVSLDAKNMTFIDTRLLYPIPQAEISNNPALSQKDQNPGY